MSLSGSFKDQPLLSFEPPLFQNVEGSWLNQRELSAPPTIQANTLLTLCVCGWSECRPHLWSSSTSPPWPLRDRCHAFLIGWNLEKRESIISQSPGACLACLHKITKNCLCPNLKNRWCKHEHCNALILGLIFTIYSCWTSLQHKENSKYLQKCDHIN